MDDPNKTEDGVDTDSPGGNDQPGGSDPIDLGLDTPLKSPILGKYKTLGEFQKAHTELQGQITRANQGKGTDNPPAKVVTDDDSRPLTVKEFNDMKAVEVAQMAETQKFQKTIAGLGLSDAQANALAAYGELEMNRTKDFVDLAKELGFSSSGDDRTDKAKTIGRDERGMPTRGTGAKDLANMTEAEMAALPIAEFEKLSNQLNTRVRR